MTREQIKLRSELRRFVKRMERLPDLFEAVEIEGYDETLTDDLSDLVRAFQDDANTKLMQICASAGIEYDDLKTKLNY